MWESFEIKIIFSCWGALDTSVKVLDRLPTVALTVAVVKLDLCVLVINCTKPFSTWLHKACRQSQTLEVDRARILFFPQ